MLKNKFKIIAFLMVIILALTLPIVRAENETATNTTTPDTTTIENTPNDLNNAEETNMAIPTNDDPMANDPTNSGANVATEDNFKRGDVYLSGDNITVDYIVDGNLFVWGNNVTINSQIGGDAFICANTLTIGEQGYVFSNLFTFAKNVTINGVVYDLYSASEATTINGYVYRDVRIGSNTANIFGTIGRNAYIDCDTIHFTREMNETDDTAIDTSTQAIINGNLEYSSNNEASIPEGVVSGETKFEPTNSFESNKILNYILKLASFVVIVAVVWLICLWLAPKFLKNTMSLLTTKKVIPVILFGILVPIVGIFLAIILCILGITSGVGLLLLLSIIALLAISTSIFVITINNLICNKLKIEKTIATFGMLVASSIILWLLALIPYVGLIINLIAMVLGLGIVVSSLVLKDKNIVE